MKRILIFTGDGKGKTTAALGTVLRAAGHGKRSLIVQFIKERADTGEVASCRFLPGVEIVQMGRGFPPNPDDARFAAHRLAATDALKFAAAALVSGKYDLLVLDEICGAIAKKLVDEDSVIALLQQPATTSCVILTGRNASARLMEQADTVTEMVCVRHALKSGVKSQEGVEY
ncbi:MAG: cob(I)yrinic acid a,c-diamide adenosyltransferase [Acidobacteriota bacterium]|jgi:cob(I)alamin adenosyltransferase|nr:cob(I)yrinic acid a,c-diamide adenosyltransferase [Acidobacteriota bacterium]